LAVINTVIGGSTCGVVVLFFYKFVLRQKWSYLMSLNGALTGQTFPNPVDNPKKTCVTAKFGKKVS
jgi:hypothetical protein